MNKALLSTSTAATTKSLQKTHLIINHLKNLSKMKKLLILIVCALAVWATSFAQTVGGGRSSGSGYDREVSKGWTSLYLQYNNIGVNHDKVPKGEDWMETLNLSKSANGISLGVNHAFNIVQTLPLYIEVGGGLQLAMYSDNYAGYVQDFYETSKYEELKYDFKGHMLSAKVPLNILYRFEIGNSDFAIEPLFGFDFRVNILGKASVNTNGHQVDKANLFDKKEMRNNPLNRFQAGWHIGANFTYSKFFVGLQYGSDFNKIHDDIYDPKVRTFTVSLGTRF